MTTHIFRIGTRLQLCFCGGLMPATGLLANTVNRQTVFDEAPWISARSAGMAEAISPIANGMEAPYYNPAVIGGLASKQERPAVTQLYFPYLGIAYNRSSQQLNRQLQSGADVNDSAVADELLDAYQGEHPYGRVSILPAITFYRCFVGVDVDMRVASTPNTEKSDVMDVNARSQSGPVLGFSFSSPKRTFYFGISGAYLNRTETKGSFTLADINDPDDRKHAFREVQRHYEGLPVNVGSLWAGPYSWHPSVSLVARNVTGTTYKAKEFDTPNYKAAEDLTLGLAVAPELDGAGLLHIVLEAGDLTQKSVKFGDKMRFGTELTLGDAFGGEAGFSLRVGYRMAGPSFGIGFNLGILGLQAASFAEDIGTDNQRVVERRSVINLGINIADY